MKRENKILLIILTALLIFIGVGSYQLLKGGKDNNSQVLEEDEVATDRAPEFYLNNIVGYINNANKLLLSKEISETEFKEDEKTHKKYYKYTGDNVDKYVTDLLLSYIDTTNEYFKIVPVEEKKSYDLYIAKPENCKNIYEVKANDIAYDEFDEELGYANVYINNVENSIDFKGTLEKTPSNILKFKNAFNPCIE